MKLWHDDIRFPPAWISRGELDGWHWVRTNQEAIRILKTGYITEVSLDYDLGLDQIDPQQYHDDLETVFKVKSADVAGTGADLVLWMIENDRVPGVVTIHSWNPVGAKEMAALLNDAGYDCVVRPFEPVKR